MPRFILPVFLRNLLSMLGYGILLASALGSSPHLLPFSELTPTSGVVLLFLAILLTSMRKDIIYVLKSGMHMKI
jgi:hypothetical protein